MGFLIFILEDLLMMIIEMFTITGNYMEGKIVHILNIINGNQYIKRLMNYVVITLKRKLI